ncbi:MAG TPA: hypothetical protein VIY51_05515 [Xanthobacteraceae bacterium]
MKTAGLNSVLSFSRCGFSAAFGLACAATLALGLLGDPASAQGTPEQRQACQPDAMRLCSQFVPDVDRITACMIKQRIRLSPACRAVFTAPPKAKSFKHSS